MTYSRKYLQQIRTAIQSKPVSEDLLSKFHGGQALTLAEEEYVCSLMSILRNNSGQYAYDVAHLAGCANYRFRRLYLIYAYDLDGARAVFDYYGLIPAPQKTIDVNFLNDEFNAWMPQVTGRMTGNVAMDCLIKETAYQIDILNKHCRIRNCSAARRTYLFKSIILHSKYIYLLVKEFDQEYGGMRTVLGLHGHQILIDEFSFIHVLFRHFAGGIKDYENNRSHHMDRTVLFNQLPLLMNKFIQSFGKNCCKREFNGRSIELIYRREKYALWFGSFADGNPPVSYLRLKTFYPINRRSYLQRIQGFKKVKVSRKLTFLVSQ